MARPPFQIGDFVGQREALTPVLREQDGALARGEPLPHMLFIGPSGIGKSLGAQAIAARAQTKMLKLAGGESVEMIVRSLVGLKSGDIAFFDECHNLPPDVQELLYEVIDSGTVPGRLATTSPDHEPVKIASLTLIFATDHPGRLRNALLKRIPTTVRFRLYPEDELREIVARVATRSELLLSPQGARQIARVCNGLPRRAEHYVLKLRLYYPDSEKRQIGLPQVLEYLRDSGIDANGLGEDQWTYLEFLQRNESASLAALAGELGVDTKYVYQQVEQPLRYRSLITVKSSGRVLTPEGKEMVRQGRPNHHVNEGE